MSTIQIMSPDSWTQDDLAVLAVRRIVADMCMQHGGGHGGSALGMAAIGVALWKYVLRFNPSDPGWFDRDRFVLSNGTSAKGGEELGAMTDANASRACKFFLVYDAPLDRLRSLEHKRAERVHTSKGGWLYYTCAWSSRERSSWRRDDHRPSRAGSWERSRFGHCLEEFVGHLQ